MQGISGLNEREILIEENKINKKKDFTATPTARGNASILLEKFVREDGEKIDNLFDKALKKSRSVDKTPTALPSKGNPFANRTLDRTEELFDDAMGIERPEQELNVSVTTTNPPAYDPEEIRKKVSERSNAMISKLKDKKLKDIEEAEPGFFDSLLDDVKEQYSNVNNYGEEQYGDLKNYGDEQYNNLKDYGEDIIKYGEGWIKKKLVETTNLLQPEDKIANKEVVVTEKFIPKGSEFTDIFNESLGYNRLGEAKSWKTGFPIHSFENAFDNDTGYDYQPLANVGNYKDTTYTSPGVAHFLLDADISEGRAYKHEYSQNMLNRQLDGTNIQPGSTVEDQYFPVYERKENGKVNIKYKTKDELIIDETANIDDIIGSFDSQLEGSPDNVEAQLQKQQDEKELKT